VLVINVSSIDVKWIYYQYTVAVAPQARADLVMQKRRCHKSAMRLTFCIRRILENQDFREKE
jgi:hypothetical protein